MKWWKGLKGRLRFKEPLGKYTSFKIGGEASILFEPKDTGDLINCLRQARKNKIPYFVLGNGTNLLIGDRGFQGVVIKLTSPSFKAISINNKTARVGAGADIKSLIECLSENNLSGGEFLSGIPASLGGALAMNAGIILDGRRFSIGDIVNKVEVLNKRGKALTLSRAKIRFGYRSSSLNRYIILQAQLKLNSDKKVNIIKRIRKVLNLRRQRQDYSQPSAGCIFKNPSPYLSAGALIDRCGLKGRSYGGAVVSRKHANFILNFNRAKASDVIKLIKIIKKKVKNNFGINLQEEIKIVS
jgi:UDP-N-acetylmuramate dehydrogenase